jgi:hypothetical protein
VCWQRWWYKGAWGRGVLHLKRSWRGVGLQSVGLGVTPFGCGAEAQLRAGVEGALLVETM